METQRHNFFSIVKVKEMLKDYVDLKCSKIDTNGGIFLSNEVEKTTIFYGLYLPVRVKTTVRSGKKTTKHVRILASKTFDHKKAKSSVCPNFIHYLDSTVLVVVSTKCMKANIPFSSAHDAFYTSLSYEKQIKRFYTEAYFEVILGDKNPLLNFIEKNKPLKMLYYIKVFFSIKVLF